MALDVLTAAQGGTCAIIKTECCMYIPDYHKNVTGLIKDMNAQIKALQGFSLSFSDWLSSWLGEGLWPNLLFGILILIVLLTLICCFVPCFSTWCRDSIATMTTPRQTILVAREDASSLSALDSAASTFRNSLIHSYPDQY